MISISTYTWLKYILFAPLNAFVLMLVITGVMEQLNLNLRKLKKRKIWGLFTVFFFSIYLAFKIIWSKVYYLEFLQEVLTCVLLGGVWTWVFLQFLDAIGYRVKNVSKLKLWVVFMTFPLLVFIVLNR